MKTKKIKKIAVFTSGGDCPGLNSALRAVVQRAHYKYGWEVYGIINGLEGLQYKQPKYKVLTPKNFNFYQARIAGSMLGCFNKGESPFDYDLYSGKELIMKAGEKDWVPVYKSQFKKLGIDGAILTGGDGSMAICHHLFQKLDINLIGIPKTIDNDTPLTETSIGYASAVDNCVSAMDAVVTTAHAHQKWMVLEVMGRYAGHIAIKTGIAGGADVIIIPEVPYKVEKIIEKIKEIKEKEGRDFGLIVVAEGALHKDFRKRKHKNISSFITEKISETGISARRMVLGHIQRGGQPNAYDRFLATSFGTRAVDCLAKGQKYKMVGYDKTGFVTFDLEQVTKSVTKNVNVKSNKIKTALNMGIYIGEIK